MLPPANAAWQYFPPHMSVCMTVCLSVCNVLTYESLYAMCRYTFRISRSSLYIKIIGLRSRSQEKNVSAYPVCGWSAFDQKAILLIVFGRELMLINIMCLIPHTFGAGLRPAVR